MKDVLVAEAAAIPDGERKIVQVDGLSIGVFHHKGDWYALRNSCLHRGGPVATGTSKATSSSAPGTASSTTSPRASAWPIPSARLDMYPVRCRTARSTCKSPT